jgi:hypothetical protein
MQLWKFRATCATLPFCSTLTAILDLHRTPLAVVVPHSLRETLSRLGERSGGACVREWPPDPGT